MPCPKKLPGCGGPSNPGCDFCLQLASNPIMGFTRPPVQPRRARPQVRAPQVNAPVQVRINTGPEHIRAFMLDIRKANGKFTRKRSSLHRLLNYLDKTKAAPVPFDSVQDAKSHCKKPNDRRLIKYEGALRALAAAWGTAKKYQVVLVAPPQPVVHGNAFQAHSAEWRNLTVTDKPVANWNGEGPRYKLEKGFNFVDMAKGSAIAWTTKKTGCHAKDVESHPEYWLKLGRMASKPNRSDKKKYVRCFTCAAIAAYTLVKDPQFNGDDIAVVGSSDYDHYFTVVGDLSKIKRGNYAGAKAIDLWQGNMKGASVNNLQGFVYTQGMEVLCEFSKNRRTAHASMNLA